tara:strand:- start:1451 stop:2179 length:729 start_codon:yes stop_codon:yes gene_type:complete
MEQDTIIIYGGSSLIAKELIKKLSVKYKRFIIFCRKKNYIDQYIKELELHDLDIIIFETDVLDLDRNYSIIKDLNSIRGLIWLTGVTGDPEEEFLDNEKCEKNIRVNFLNPVLIINKIIPKIIEDADSFVVILASVAGLRGRKKNLYYSSSKSGLIAYLSGLRQKLAEKKINVITVIPGYMKTRPFNLKAPSFLVTTPKKASDIICNAIFSKKEIVYINFFWKIIMLIVRMIPEKIFKKFNF